MRRPRVGPRARLSWLRIAWPRLAALSILLWLAAGGMGWDRSRAEPGEPAPSGVQAAPLKISGESTWSLRLGWGDPETLAALGLAAGSPVFSQSLSLDLEGEVAPGMALSAHLDNGNSGNLQLASVAARIPWGRLSLGKITVQPRNSLLAYNSAIMGASYAGDVHTPLGPWQVWASAGRVLGVPASRTFQGNSAEESVVFAPDGPYVPTWQAEGSTEGFLVGNVDGVAFFVLQGAFDPDFMGTWLKWVDQGAQVTPAQRPLADVLASNGLDFLATDGLIAAGKNSPLDESHYGTLVTTSRGESILFLRQSPEALIRLQIQSAIRAYNQQHRLSGDASRRYPFVMGSPSEQAFLNELIGQHLLLVAGRRDDQGSPVPGGQVLEAPLASYERRRFYWVGHGDLLPGSVSLDVWWAGQWQPATAFPDLHWQQYPQAGVVELPWLPGWERDQLRLRITYRYTLNNNVFPLGVSVAYGTEKVYLNGQLLKPEKDYTLDYDSGILVLLRAVKPEDVLRVDFEYDRGGLGHPAERKQNYAGLGVSGQLGNAGLALEVVHGADLPVTNVSPERTHTMPESHTVAGAQLHWPQVSPSATPSTWLPAAPPSPWELTAQVAYSYDRFPFDNNLRAQQANRINSMLAVPGDGGTWLLLVGDQNGLHATTLPANPGGSLPPLPASPEAWHHYGPGQGLAGATVRDLALLDASQSGEGRDLWLAAGEGGLTIITAPTGPGETLANLDESLRWRRVRDSNGLPAADITALAVSPAHDPLAGGAAATVWVGTEKGIAWTTAGQWLTWHTLAWTALQPGSGAGSSVASGAVLPSRVNRLCPIDHETVYVATDQGLYKATRRAAGAQIVAVQAGEVLDLALWEAGAGRLYLYALTPQGLWAYDLENPGAGEPASPAGHRVWDIAAVGGGQAVALAAWDGTLWVGTSHGLLRLRPAADGTIARAEWVRIPGATNGEAGSILAPGITCLWPAAGHGADQGAGSADWPPALFVAGSGTRGTTETPLHPGEPETGPWLFTLAAQSGATGSFLTFDQMGLGSGDRGRFQDIPAEGHEAVGWAGNAELSYTWQAGRVYAAYQMVQPGYLPLGGWSRQNLQQWQTGGWWQALPGLQMSWTVRDTRSLPDRSGARAGGQAQSTTRAYEGSARFFRPEVPDSLEWELRGSSSTSVVQSAPAPGDGASGGGGSGPGSSRTSPSGPASLSQERRDSLALLARRGFWQRRLSLAIGYEWVRSLSSIQIVGQNPGEGPSSAPEGAASSWRFSENILAEASLEPWPGLKLNVTWRQPVNKSGSGAEALPASAPFAAAGTAAGVSGISGSQQWSWGASWNRNVGSWRIACTYGGQDQSDLVQPGGHTTSHTATANITLPSVVFAGWEAEPSASLDASSRQALYGWSAVAWRARNGVQLRRGAWDVNAAAAITSSDGRFTGSPAPGQLANPQDHAAASWNKRILAWQAGVELRYDGTAALSPYSSYELLSRSTTGSLGAAASVQHRFVAGVSWQGSPGLTVDSRLTLSAGQRRLTAPGLAGPARSSAGQAATAAQPLQLLGLAWNNGLSFVSGAWTVQGWAKVSLGMPEGGSRPGPGLSAGLGGLPIWSQDAVLLAGLDEKAGWPATIVWLPAVELGTSARYEINRVWSVQGALQMNRRPPVPAADASVPADPAASGPAPESAPVSWDLSLQLSARF